MVRRKRERMALQRQADAILRAEDPHPRALPTTGAQWLAQTTTEPVRHEIYRRMCEFDEQLVPLRHRALHPTWRVALRRWLCESEAFGWTVRKGRRIGASTVIAPRLIAAWVLSAVPRIQLPPGEIVVVGLVSVKKGEASNRIKQISAVLTAVGVPHVAKSSQIDLIGAPVEIRVITRNWKTAVGENIGLLWCDEVSRWESDESSANPATEVIGSLKPALATLQVQGLALMCLVSSPWSEDDYHAQQFTRGDTEDQCTAFIPTWTARDDITEKQTHRLEADDRVWAREYAAIPGHMVSTALDSEDVNAAFGMVVPAGDIRRYCCIDASSLRGDAFAWMLGHEARGGLVVDRMEGFGDMSLRDLTLDTVVDEIAMACRAAGIKTVWGDQREEAGLEVLFRQRGLVLETFAWTNPSKHEAFTFFRRLLRDRRVQLCAHAELQKQMRQCKARLLPSGVTSYETNGLDYLSTIITLLHAYQRNWPNVLAQLISGRALPSPKSPEELVVERNRADADKYLREAKKRAAQKTKNIWRLR
jgi:hypothetical protein